MPFTRQRAIVVHHQVLSIPVPGYVNLDVAGTHRLFPAFFHCRGRLLLRPLAPARKSLRSVTSPCRGKYSTAIGGIKWRRLRTIAYVVPGNRLLPYRLVSDRYAFLTADDRDLENRETQRSTGQPIGSTGALYDPRVRVVSL